MIDVNLENENPKTDEQCKVRLGHKNCARMAHVDGPHVCRYPSGHEYLYDYDDPTQMVFGLCKTCFVELTEDNQSNRPGCHGYCGQHDEAAYQRYFDRNGCKKCGFVGTHELRNYDMMWHDGDIHCGRCGAYVRMYDAG